jgi:hypothetical protein
VELERRQRRRISVLGAVGACVLVVGVALVAYRVVKPPLAFDSSAASDAAAIAPAIYALPPRSPDDFRSASAVKQAASFLESLQPTGTYVLTTRTSSAVVPMDLAHAAIALTKVNQLSRARAAMAWLYSNITTSSDLVDSTAGFADYAGSWYDGIGPDGRPATGSRGRGEAVGMALIATHTIWSADPGFLMQDIGDHHVVDLVRLSVQYLTQPAMNHSDGCFSHSPDYPVAFNEECARMSLGLRLAGEMLHAAGDNSAATSATRAADRGVEALRNPTGLNQGMAYDYYAMGIWGLGSRDDAKSEVIWARSTGLIGPDGVRNWDWQMSKATSLLTWLHWWAQAQTIAPSETFDYAIASVSAGDVGTALDLERRWLPRQRADGSFADSYIFGLRLGVTEPTSYAVSRFILLESLLTSIVGRR